MNSSFDRPPAGRTSSGSERIIGLDVARAVSLIGVVVMNYHGMMNYPRRRAGPASLIERVFDIETGPLSTRFAATFVVVAGIGVTLLTDTARRDGSRAALAQARMRLARRGAVLLIVGYFLDWAWPGTILFYYGIYFLIAAGLFHMGTRALAAIASCVALGGLAVSVWRRHRLLEGDSTSWVSPSEIHSVQDFLTRAFLGYTHPVLPWLAFVLIGMIAGRYLDVCRRHTVGIAAVLVATIAASYVGATSIRAFDVADRPFLYAVSSMHPSENGLAYTVSTAAIALVAFVLVSDIARAHRSRLVVSSLQRAGQLSLSLYLGHVLFYYAVVEWSGWNLGSGLAAAIVLALSYWALAIVGASWWHHRIGSGPAERIYRWLGG